MKHLWSDFGKLGALFVLGVCAILLVGRKKKSNQTNNMALSTDEKIKVVVWGILLVTMIPDRFALEARILNLVPFTNLVDMIFQSKNKAIWNIGANLGMFMPFGYLVAKKMGTKRKVGVSVAAAGFAFSLAIETVQYILPTGRSADIDDLILNTLGSYLGFIVWKICTTQASEGKKE